MKKLILTAAAVLLSAFAYKASAQYVYPQYASAVEYRPLASNEAVLLTDEEVAALDSAGVIDWSKGALALKGTKLAQRQTVLNKKGKEVVKKVPFSKEEQAAILSDIDGTDFNPQWKKNAVLQTTGMWMLIGGSLFLIGGSIAGGGMLLVGVIALPIVVAFAAVFTGGKADVSGMWDSIWDGIKGKVVVGGSIAMVGTAVAITGAVLLSVGHKNLKRTVKYANEMGKPSYGILNVGATPSGVGLTFNF